MYPYICSKTDGMVLTFDIVYLSVGAEMQHLHTRPGEGGRMELYA